MGSPEHKPNSCTLSGRAKLCLTLLVLGGFLAGKVILEVDVRSGLGPSSDEAVRLLTGDGPNLGVNKLEGPFLDKQSRSDATSKRAGPPREARRRKAKGKAVDKAVVAKPPVSDAALSTSKGPRLDSDGKTRPPPPPRPDPYCKLPPMSPILKIKKTKGPGCKWTWTGSRGQCKYNLVGNCHEVLHKETNCTFYGHPRNEQRNLDWFYLPPAEGEEALSAKEKLSLKRPFTPCDSRPKFYLITTPPMASLKEPLALLAGGAPSMDTHVYFVEGEVAGDDVYSMSKQNVEDMKIIVDLGGNIGLFAISACKRFPKARILSFEPHPGNYRLMVYNVRKAGCSNVETYNKGLSMDGRNMVLYWHDSIGTSAYRGPTAWEPKPATLHMETISPGGLYELVGADKAISLMKVDCEGCEYEIVPLIQQWRVERMFCEVHYTTVNILAGHSMIKGMTEKKMKMVENACKKGRPFNDSLAGMPAGMKPPDPNQNSKTAWNGLR